jgi:phenylalanyl-tRNA synthetase beta subunit
LGEIHPKVLTAWGLEKPVVAFELALDTMKR